MVCPAPMTPGISMQGSYCPLEFISSYGAPYGTINPQSAQSGLLVQLSPILTLYNLKVLSVYGVGIPLTEMTVPGRYSPVYDAAANRSFPFTYPPIVSPVVKMANLLVPLGHIKPGVLFLRIS